MEKKNKILIFAVSLLLDENKWQLKWDNMTKREISKLFEDRKIRTVWDDKEEKWYFSIVDVVAVLTDSENPQTYWRVLKNRLKKEGNQTVTNCNALKLRAADGKMRLTDVADTEQLFRLIQSIPSPKAEPIKQWIAHVAAERIAQTLEDNMKCAADGGDVARVAREQLEAKTGRNVISPLSAKRFFEEQRPNKEIEDGEESEK